ncbi:hypothetical protein [Alteromonas antoniana]|nr:hypothetical protein [Alteromonas antoniana]
MDIANGTGIEMPAAKRTSKPAQASLAEIARIVMTRPPGKILLTGV